MVRVEINSIRGFLYRDAIVHWKPAIVGYPRHDRTQSANYVSEREREQHKKIPRKISPESGFFFFYYSASCKKRVKRIARLSGYESSEIN